MARVRKRVLTTIKLQIASGQASPTPPVGPALGQHGVNIVEFCKAFNAQTQDMQGLVVPVVITVYADRSFSFVLKSPLASVLLKRAAKVEKGSPESNRMKVGTVSRGQVQEIAELKMVDLNASSLKTAVRMIEGTARSMGLEVSD